MYHHAMNGLHMGEFVEAGSWPILGYMMVNCKTLGETFEKSGRYLCRVLQTKKSHAGSALAGEIETVGNNMEE